MGTYLNPGNNGFQRIVKGEYIDKTGLIGLINSTIGTTKNLICISRPRRFGKSYAAQMLCAYYDKTCDSHSLFDPYVIASDPSYEEHIQKYDVIYIDVAGLIGETSVDKVVEFIKESVIHEIKDQYPGIKDENGFISQLVALVEHTNNKIIMIIDEWDAPIRESGGQLSVQKEYLEFLRSLFKNSGTTSKIFAAAYMTGILPIKKDGSQSAISDFREYSMLEPLMFAEYVGFTEDEVRQECIKNNRDYTKMKNWYDGYTVGNYQTIYNPYSVMHALETGKYISYWKQTTAADTLMTYIDMDMDGLQADIVRLIAGESIVVDTGSFQNDVETFTCKDDVLTLLIHLGYLTYDVVSDPSYSGTTDELTGLAKIPNEEVRSEFERILRRSKHKTLIDLVRKSDQLLQDTLSGNEEAVARAIEEVRITDYAPQFYNNEQSLRYTIKMAYLSCIDQYAVVQELPSGQGIADVVFIPKRKSSLPGMIIELKWDKSASGALNQIKEKGYQGILENYIGKVVLVEINYSVKTKNHSCKIEFANKST